MSGPAAFWDASAIVPLCVHQSSTAQAREHLNKYLIAAWWGSSVEGHSAIARLYRTHFLNADQRDEALVRLDALVNSWDEVRPSHAVRSVARRLLDQYQLRAADSLQLAAALVWCAERPAGEVFICGDQRLGNAAESSGFYWHRLATTA